MKMPRRLLMLLLVSALATGCAVTTDPLTKDELINRVNEDRINMYRDQEPLAAPLSMEEALARGLKYNLDHRVKLMEDALAMRQMDLMTFDMLPRLVAAAGYGQRDTYNASYSDIVDRNDHRRPKDYDPYHSTSSERGHWNADLTMTWNILDFGVSYFQAKQQAERAHIMKERRRKVVHTIFQQIRQAYWQALGAQELEKQFAPLLADVNAALSDIEKIEAEKLRPAMETLNYKKTLLEIVKQLETFRDELAQAKPRLAALINLPIGQSFSLADPGSLAPPQLNLSLEEMETLALAMRPELREVDYNKRISAHEVKKTILRMLPGIELTVGGHYDSNTFLLHEKWIEGSARMTWNLLNLLSGPTQYKLAKGQEELAQTQRMALGMAVLTQVHVAHQDYLSRKRQFDLADQLMTIDARIHALTAKQAGSGAESRLNAIKSATGSLMADYRRYQNYAALQNAYGQINTTLGLDPLPETIESHDLKALSGEIKKRLDLSPVPIQEAANNKFLPRQISGETASINQPQVIDAAVAAAVVTEEAIAPVAEPVVATEAVQQLETVAEKTANDVVLPVADVAALPENPDLSALMQKAENGDAIAQRQLGWHYSNGNLGLPLDKDAAINWYEKAAKRGDMQAQQALGWLYYSGEGVSTDLVKSRAWYQKAAEQGSAKSVAMLRKIEKDGM